MCCYFYFEYFFFLVVVGGGGGGGGSCPYCLIALDICNGHKIEQTFFLNFISFGVSPKSRMQLLNVLDSILLMGIL